MNPLRLSLFALLLLAVLGLSQEAEAEHTWELTSEYIGEYYTDELRSVAISGDYAYIGGRYDGLLIINIEDPTNPTLVGSYDISGTVSGVTISGNYAYITHQNIGLVIVNIEDPTNLTLVGSYDTNGEAFGVTISGNYAYIADGVSGLFVINIEDPTNLTLVGIYDTGSYAYGVAISENYAYVADGGNGLVIVNIEDPTNLTLVGSYDTDGWAYDVNISGNYAYVADGEGGLIVLNIEDPTNPNHVVSYDANGEAFDVAISGNYAYIAVGSGQDDGLIVLNIEDPTNPQFVGKDDRWGYLSPHNVAISGNYAYVIDDHRLLILEFHHYPLAVIDSIYPSPAKFSDEVSFSGSGEVYEGIVINYTWASSIDGELSKERNFTTTNLSLGNHIITLWVQGNDGLQNIIQESDNLWIYAFPVAIAGQDSTGTPGVPLQFSGAGTDEDGTIAKYEWDFDGDGVFEWSSTENGLNTYIYNNEDTYTATLRVTDNDGFTDTDTVVITVTEKKIQIVDDDDGNVTVTVTDAEEDEEGIPGIGIIAAMVSIGLIARFRRR